MVPFGTQEKVGGAVALLVYLSRLRFERRLLSGVGEPFALSGPVVGRFGVAVGARIRARICLHGSKNTALFQLRPLSLEDYVGQQVHLKF